MEGLTRRPQHTRTPMHGSIRKKYAMATDSMTDSFMRNLPNLLCAVALLALSASAAAASPPKSGTSFLETWKDPDAQPLQLKGAKVVAVVMMNDPKARRLAEDALAKEITKLGAQGVPMYSIAPAGVAPKEGGQDGPTEQVPARASRAGRRAGWSVREDDRGSCS